MKAKTGSVSFDSARQQWRAQITTPSGRILKRFPTKQEASDWLAKQQTAITEGTFVEPSSISLGTWLVTWLRDYKRASLSQRTLELYVMLIGKCKSIADYRLQSITAPMIQKLYSELSSEGLGNSSINKVHKVLNAAFKKAVQIDFLSRNIMEAVECPKFETRHEIHTFTRAELDAILDASKKYCYGRYYTFILTAITTGMRMGELLALRWCDVSMKKRQIHVTRNLQQTLTKGIIINPPKTKSGRRLITVPQATITAMQEMRAKHSVESVDELIFVTATGTPFGPRNIQRVWRAIVKLSGVPYRNFHVLRHTHATDLLADGVPIVEVARRLGHARVSHTLELYGHAIPSYDQEIADKVAKLYIVK